MTVTLADYGHDYTALIEYQRLIMNIEKQVAASYVRAICEKRMSFKNYDERKTAAELIVEDTNKVCIVGVEVVCFISYPNTR